MSDKCPEHPEEKKLYCFKCVDRIADQRYNQAFVDMEDALTKVVFDDEGDPLNISTNDYEAVIRYLKGLKKPASQEGE